MKPFAFHPQAGEEYTQAAQYYAAIVPALGGRFSEEIERLILEIRRQPDRFFRFSPLTGSCTTPRSSPLPAKAIA